MHIRQLAEITYAPPVSSNEKKYKKNFIIRFKTIAKMLCAYAVINTTKCITILLVDVRKL